MPGSFDAILLDLGGVLIEVTGARRLLEWAAHLGSVEKVWERWLTSPAVRSFETGRSSPLAFAEALIGEMALPVGAEQFLAEFATWPRGCYPGARRLVDQLASRYRVGCLANSNVLHWQRIGDEMELLDGFHVRLASHQIGVLKPDAEAFQAAIEALGTVPGRILFIDDNTLNVEAARRAGLVAQRAEGLLQTVTRLQEAGVRLVDWPASP